MEEQKVHLISKISDYLRARLWLRDYTEIRNSTGCNQTVLLDTGDHAGQEIFCSLMNGSIAPLENLTP
ncbi:MAG: hypothetical protein JRF72_15680 [Deltaproteobacteria bacterium]|jgi:hypothetical protein|nr:hypothetical protein [Deltaproteobacteria bacterium]